MINRLIFIFLIFCINSNIVNAQEFFFETKTIEIIKDQNIIIAKNGKATSNNGDIEIQAELFEYNQSEGILEVTGNGIIDIKSDNLKIFFDKSIIDKKNNIISVNNKIKIINHNKNFNIDSNLITYDKNKRTLSSNTKTTILDDLNNYYQSDNFYFEINKQIIKFKNLIFKDEQRNIFNTSLAFMNIETGKLIGKDFDLELFNPINDQNKPRLKGISFSNDKKITQINKGVFTNCKKSEKCPPWKLTSKKIQHNKVKKQINYEDAKLYLYDVPVMYFPKFFHPDPTVERQSGFLIPSFNNSLNSSNYFSIPYYLVVAENKDFTFSPRIYSNNDFLFQTEYRQKNSRSNHIADLSFFKNKNKNNNHIFYNYDSPININNFENSNLNFQFQKSSNRSYIKKNKIKSELIQDANTLKNSLGLDLFNENLSIEIETSVYENLTKNDNDKYEYILPELNLIKRIKNNTKMEGDIYFKSENLLRNYNTNIFESSNINDLLFTSFPKKTSRGFVNNYEFILKNANTDSKKSTKFKNKESSYISGAVQLNSSIPLIKRNGSYNQIFEPKFAMRIAPDHTKNYKNEENIIDINSLYSLNRINKNDTIEGGLSFIYGTSYLLSNNLDNNEFFRFRVSNNLRLKENDDINGVNQLNKKMSNIFSEVVLNPNENFEIKYNNAIKNDLSTLSNESIFTKINISNFNFLFDYFNENNTVEKNSYLLKSIDYKFNDFNNLSFSTRENKSKDLTEFYKLVYEYKNDCLSASIEYNKNFYSDNDLAPEENVLFKLSIIPFGEGSSPNLMN